MKIIFVINLLFFSYTINAQTEEEVKRYLDTLKMGGSYLIGKSLPGFKLASTKGQTYSSENLKGKVTLINLWFEACEPCMAEMNSLNELYERFKGRKSFQFLSITFESKKDVKRIVSQHKIRYPVISTTRDSCYLMNFGKGFPTTVVTDSAGRIAYFRMGGPIDSKTADDSIKTRVYPFLEQMLK